MTEDDPARSEGAKPAADAQLNFQDAVLAGFDTLMSGGKAWQILAKPP
jgi:hypothetical protein